MSIGGNEFDNGNAMCYHGVDMKHCKNHNCKKKFRPARSWQVYCSHACANLIRVRSYRERHKISS